MNRRPHSFIWVLMGVCLLSGLVGCDRQPAKDQPVLRVGVIASLSGPARPWGLVTVRCAQVIANYYNEQGGFDVGGEKVRIELIIRDDAFNAWKAASIAHDFSLDGINYVIGPLGDGPASAAARVMDSAGIVYLHYGFNREMRNSDGLGLLGMPLPEQSLPILFHHLQDEQDVGSVLILAYDTEEGIHQKKIAEKLAIDTGLDLIRFYRFDVSEETFDMEMDPESIQRSIGRIVAAAPDALIVTGCPPEPFVVLVDRLRRGGYDQFIGTQNFQDADMLAKLGGASDGVYYVGGAPADGVRSEYFRVLKARYLDIAGSWSEEAETKLYALESILACIRKAGIDALEDTSLMDGVIPELRFEDPFHDGARMITVIGGADEGFPRQIQTPIRISRMSGGRNLLVEERFNGAP